MSGPSKGSEIIIQNKGQLVEWFAEGAVPKEDLLVGMEHEKPPVYSKDGAPVAYSGKEGRAGVRDLFNLLVVRKGWEAGTLEAGNIIDLSKGRANITLEPAIQIEHGGAPFKSIHEIAAETDELIEETAELAAELGFRMIATGFHPTHRADTLELMKKSRYEVYQDYISGHGIQNGMDLIACTSTVQANLGFTSELDFVRKIRASINAAPAVIAMFATSPFADGGPTEYQSYRSHVLNNGWQVRFGFMLPVAFEKDFGFERYTDFVLEKMPMLGFYEGHTFKPAKLGKFADFMEAKLEVCHGRQATLGDWSDLLNTVWPDTRPRRFLEMRSADVGPQEMIKALGAFWKGLLYDDTSLDAVLELTKHWSNEDREYLRAKAPQSGMQTTFKSATLQDICKELVGIADAGLKRMAVLDAKGQDESKYLEPLKEITQSGLNWAQRLMLRYHGAWKGDLCHLYTEMDYAAAPSVLKPAPAIPLNSKIFSGKKGC